MKILAAILIVLSFSGCAFNQDNIKKKLHPHHLENEFLCSDLENTKFSSIKDTFKQLEISCNNGDDFTLMGGAVSISYGVGDDPVFILIGQENFNTKNTESIAGFFNSKTKMNDDPRSQWYVPTGKEEPVQIILYAKSEYQDFHKILISPSSSVVTIK